MTEDELNAEVHRLRGALKEAERSMVHAHYHIAEQLNDCDVSWLMEHLARGYSAAMAALGEHDDYD